MHTSEENNAKKFLEIMGKREPKRDGQDKAKG